MKRTMFAVAAVVACAAPAVAQQQFVSIAGAPCAAPPPLHCPDADCGSDRVINQGPVTEMKTRRTYFLDYPCDLKPGEPVTFVLSLHGAGSYGNWQRHYFPILDFKDKYRLVVATPNSPTHVWSDVDDQYLHNIVDFVVEQIGRQNIKAFWLAGHSQGGLTSNRLIRTDYFKDKVDGFLSLSGGRLGGSPGRGSFAGMARGPAPAAGERGAAPPAARGAVPGGTAVTGLPNADFSFIFATGQREMDDKGLPETSEWAAKYSCGPRRRLDDVVDTKAGYIYDRSRQSPPVPAWGLLPAPGSANVYQYPGCKDGRIVADVVRLAKGHTEGLEPNVTEALVKLMLSAPGGKLQKSAGTR
jgi:pimeloyl-ACP methyl ester carboxylesterase